MKREQRGFFTNVKGVSTVLFKKQILGDTYKVSMKEGQNQKCEEGKLRLALSLTKPCRRNSEIPLSTLCTIGPDQPDLEFNSWTCLAYCSSQPSMVHWLSSSIFPCSVVRPAMVTSDRISTFFNTYRHKSPILTQYHHISTSTTLY